MPLPALAGVAGFLESAGAAELVKGGLSGLVGFEPFLGWLQSTADQIMPGVTERWTTFQLQNRANYMTRLVRALIAAEGETAPQMASLAVLGIQDVFGVQPPAAALVGRGGSAARDQALAPVADIFLAGLFGSLGGVTSVTPEAGYANMKRLVQKSIVSGIQSWLVGNLGLGILSHDLPDWGKLGEIVTDATGLGRVTSAALAPVLNAMVVDPARRQLNRIFQPAIPSESQAVRMRFRDVISESTYFDLMAQQGWSREWAAEWLSVYATLPSRSDLRAMLEQEELDATGVTQYLVAQGHPPDVAAKLTRVIANDRVRALKQSLVTLARDMYRDRDAEADVLDQVAHQVGYTQAELDWLVAGANLERSRAKRMSESDMEAGYVADLVTMDELQSFYQLQGYAERSVDILTALAAAKKAKAEAAEARRRPRPAPESLAAIAKTTALEANRRGILTDPQLREILVAQGMAGAALETTLALAQARRADYVAAIAKKQAPKRAITASAGTIEEAYVRGIVGDDELLSFYSAQGFEAPLLDVLIQLRRAERADYQARAAAAAARAQGSPDATAPN